MHKFARLSVLAVLAALVVVPVARGFFNQLDELKQELVAYQATNTADFTDLMNTLDDLSAPTFDDVADTDWFGSYVASVSSWGVVSGYKDAQGQSTGKFGPGNPVTVAEMLKIAFKSAHVDEATCVLPPSLPQAIGHWAQKFVSCGEARGMRILQDKNLDLNRPATRAEVLAILDDAYGEKVPAIFSNFRDTQGHPLESDIAYAYSRGIVSGDKDANGIALGLYRPNANIVRAEVAKIIYEWQKSIVKQEVATGS